MIGKLIVLMVIVAAATANATVKQVSVTIYYEALCPDSKSFFTEHFKPTWDLLKKYIKLELVPFGKSKSTDYRIDQTQTSPSNVKFTCRHTDNECLGHRYQACILNETRAYDWNDKVNFINCLMSKSSITTLYGKTIESCQDKAGGIQIEYLQECVGNELESNKLLLELEKKTNAFWKPLESVPTLVFNNETVVVGSDANNFQRYLCDKITDDPKPDSCKGHSGAPATTVGLITLFAAGLVIRML